nr:restriction endonuclease subunit S [Bifidobacterium breve]
MMTEQAKVPAIRFAGFTDPWEQRKLGDYVVVSTAKNADGRFNKEDVLSVSGEYGIVNQIAFQGRSFAGSSVLNYGIVNTGDIVYTKSPLNSNPYGIIKVNKGIPGIVSTLYAVYRPQDNVHTNFIQVYFEQHERMNNYMHPLVNKGAKNDMKVTAENALKGVVTFPSREEQVIISEFFDRLDSLITLHQRKYDKLVVFKKSMLEKMFPKDGESVPEIRFAGFTDPWEQRKFSEIVDVCSGRDYKHLDEGPIPVYGTGGYMTSVSEALSHNRDAIGIGRKGTIDKPYLLKAPFWTVDTLFYAIPKSDINLEFALCSFLNVDWKSKDESTGLPSLSKESINETVLSVPNVVEQNHLGNFFADLDRLITLHQRKLELLQNIKKSLLDKMFV